ncbi:hypothetical protein [Mesorhizobium sp. B2-6-2]|uniref:hypothetical protein n=1 Tax=Mesorhizobium sp. B2-6-2 TaxID=2589915 RepID=UPI00112CDA80|nr:hypothetical protein [Mesorhizobium sp. B2-6-2]TPJ77172.1 hypothetical protein FJ419_16755 [Mesorhizobium sp. B2-6-2]
MQKNNLAALAACVMLGGCAMTLPVTGQSGDGAETFTGSATGYADGAGNLTITSNKGRKCKGDFVYVNRREGSGTFTCSDGSSGPFTFVSTGMRGTGTGTLGGKPFTFSFG